MDKDGLVISMIADTLEEYSASQQGNLQCLDIEVDVEFVPCVESDGVGEDRRKQPIKVEEEEQASEKCG